MTKAAVCVSLAAMMLTGCARPEGGVTEGRAPTMTRTFVLDGVGAPRFDVGVPGRLDHFAYDPATGRLFAAALENGSLEVLDLDEGERVRSLGGLGHPQGIAVVASHGCAAVACGQDGGLHVYDTRTLDEKRVIDVGRGADNVRYDATADTVYVAYGDTKGGAIAVLDARDWKKLREIPFRHRPESFQLEPNGVRLFANLPGGIRAENDGAVAVADRNTGQVIAEVPLPARARNFPMAFDAAHQRLFVVSRKPAKLIAIDTRTCAIISEADCSEDSDDLFYDAKTNRVLVIGGGYRPDMVETVATSQRNSPDETGAIDVFSVGERSELTRVELTRTAPHARTGFFVPDRRTIYVAVPPREGRSSEIREYRVP
jgi:hypothetical protein